MVDHTWRYMTYMFTMKVLMKNQKYNATICDSLFDKNMKPGVDLPPPLPSYVVCILQALEK